MTDVLVQQKWIQLISPNLERFSRLDSKSYKFRCPICGDSQKNKTKTRGYIFLHKDTFFMKCHNCGASMSFSNFIKNHFSHYYHEYRLDLFKERQSKAEHVLTFAEVETEDSPEVPTKPIEQEFVTLNMLPSTHPAVLYASSRLIPESKFDRIIYADNFKNWLLSVTDKYVNRPMPWDARIILPLKDENGNIFGVQARAIDKAAKQRYITIKFDDKKPKIYGLEKLNTSLPYFIVEGPIDSLFLPNAIAICGGDVSLSLAGIPNKKNAVLIFDNEPRSKDTIHRMEKAIDMGFSISFWDYDPRIAKDINDLVMKGYRPLDICKRFYNNAVSGMAAKIKLTQWKKI